MTFTACRVFDEQGRPQARIVEMDVDALSPGDVLVRIEWSGINFKDALAVTGRGRILKRLPLNAGIDFAGRVVSSDDARFRAGDAVIANGMGLGEVQDGGLAEFVRVPADTLIPLPPGLSLRTAMICGTAGFTAALSLQRMETNGQQPGAGPIVVTGATGGVGSFALVLLAAHGYRTIAMTGRPEHEDYLRGLGADEVTTPERLQLGSRPLEAARFGGAIDNVGGPLLAGLLRHVTLWGNVASVGMAADPSLAGTVFPLILRGVSLLGVSSNNCPMPLRTLVWSRLARDLPAGAPDAILNDEIPLTGVPEACERLMARQAKGRTLVRCAEERAAP